MCNGEPDGCFADTSNSVCNFLQGDGVWYSLADYAFHDFSEYITECVY